MNTYAFVRTSTGERVTTVDESLKIALLSLPREWRQTPHDLRVTISSCTELDYWKARCRNLEQQLKQVLAHAR